MHICKSYTFDAAHQIHGLPEGHKCARMHGHTYRVDIIVQGLPLDDVGMIVDYAKIDEVWQPLHDLLDHRYLNDIPGLEKPTTEVLAYWIFERLQAKSFERPVDASVTKVRVHESSTTYCEAP